MPREHSRKRATLTDVGRLAGVSNVAASAVLNGSKTNSRVSEESRKRILEAARELNYRPNIAARALVKNRMDLIGVAVLLDEDEINHYFMEVFNGILEEAKQQNQNTTIFHINDWNNAATELNRCCDGRIDGMILVAPIIPPEEITKLPTHTPFVALHSNRHSDHIINIESDEENGAYQITSHLIEAGHKKIAHFGVGTELVGGRRRLDGYKKALSDAGIEYNKDLHYVTDYGVEGGIRAMQRWIESNGMGDFPDAIFCANDGIAIGCLEVLSENGVSVPETLTLCGFDDTLAARTTVPQLSTVRQPLRSMGHQAVRELMAMIENNASQRENPIVFNTELIIRKSTAGSTS